jgi:hypothetical protein
MGSIDFYEKRKTSELKHLLKHYEYLYEKNEIRIDDAKFKNLNYQKLEEMNHDYDIDISLIRMELNRRLWKGDF